MRGAAMVMILLAALALSAAGSAQAGDAVRGETAVPQAAPPLSAADLARIAEVAAAVDRAHDELQRIALVELQRPDVAARWRARVAKLKAAFAGISRPDHPRALAIARKIAAIEDYVEAGIARAGSMTGSLEGAGAAAAALA